jgi:hypothetical protein
MVRHSRARLSLKRDFTQQNFLFRQNMCGNLKFLTAEKIRFKKKQTFVIGPVVFAPRTQTYVLHSMGYLWSVLSSLPKVHEA